MSLFHIKLTKLIHSQPQNVFQTIAYFWVNQSRTDSHSHSGISDNFSGRRGKQTARVGEAGSPENDSSKHSALPICGRRVEIRELTKEHLHHFASPHFFCTRTSPPKALTVYYVMSAPKLSEGLKALRAGTFFDCLLLVLRDLTFICLTPAKKQEEKFWKCSGSHHLIFVRP